MPKKSAKAEVKSAADAKDSGEKKPAKKAATVKKPAAKAESKAVTAKKPAKKAESKPAVEKKTAAKAGSKAAAEKKPAKKAAKKPKRKSTPRRPKTTSDGYKIYYPDAKRDAYKKGEIVYFEKVRDWINRGVLVNAHGKITALDLFDGDIPFIEVSFSDTKKMNKVDLGDDVRKFILESKQLKP